MESLDLTTNELLIINLYTTGATPTSIALQLGMTPSAVRSVLKRPSALAYRMEQEECTDETIRTLYRDGADAIRRALTNGNAATQLKAAELIFKVLGKVNKVSETDKGTSISQIINNVTNILQAPLASRELQSVTKYFEANDTNGTNPPPKAIQGTTLDS